MTIEDEINQSTAGRKRRETTYTRLENNAGTMTMYTSLYATFYIQYFKKQKENV